MNYIYFNGDGKIVRTHSASRSLDKMPQIDGLTIIECNQSVDTRKHYYDGGIFERSIMNLSCPESVGVDDSAEISGIPDNTTVRWPDGFESIESGSITFESGMSGPHKFLFENVRYISESAVINVT